MKYRPAAVRFWEKVKIGHGCWEWTAAQKGGYGTFWVSPTTMVAHRFSYEEVWGPVPEELELDHLCRNQLCVRPSHLEAVTHRENVIRGVNPAAIHAAATHCPKGHPYDEANTIIAKRSNWRSCRACKVTWNWNYRQSQRVSPLGEKEGS